MNSKFIATAVVTLAALSSASAFAGSSSQYAEPAEFANNTGYTSQVTRAQVRAEYLQARQNGTLELGQEFDINPSNDGASVLTRTQVRAQKLAGGSSLPSWYSNTM